MSSLPNAAQRTPNGWADDRMMQAYDLIWAVRHDNKTLGVEPEFRALCIAIEAADDLLAETRSEAA